MIGNCATAGTLENDFYRVLGRSQDTLGRSTGFQLKDGSTLENQAAYAYSATDGRLQSISGGGLQPPSPANTFTYNYLPNSNLIEKISGPIHDVNNTWEPNRNVLASKQNKVGTTVISQYDYTVNAIGQRTNLATSGSAFPNVPSWLWGYDSLGQVISADSSVNANDRAFQYDTIGNRLKSADSLTLPTTNNYAPNALNQYTAIGAFTPTYDFDGNQIDAQVLPLGSSSLASCVYSWDAENRLISTTVSGVTTTYQYDSQSRRISKSTNGVNVTFVYDGWNPIAEYVGSALTKSYAWGIDLSGSMQGAGGVGGLLSVKIGANSYYPTYDGNGNVSEYLDNAGAVAAHFEYDPFGRTVVDTDNGGLFAHRFSTKPTDSETGLYYYGYRYYDPSTGRWPSRDPIGENGGENLYGFCYNDPQGWYDYLGGAPQHGVPPANQGPGRYHDNNTRPNTGPLNTKGNNNPAATDEPGSAPGNTGAAVTAMAQALADYAREQLFNIKYYQAYDKCYERAKHIFTKGTGTETGTTCEVCCQVQLHISTEGVTEAFIWKMFYGACSENEKDREKWLNQPSINTPGGDINFVHPFRYSQFR